MEYMDHTESFAHLYEILKWKIARVNIWQVKYFSVESVLLK